MTRQIKFRCWDGEKMRIGDEGFNHDTCKMLGSAYGVGWPIMQYTGLLDSKGKEIWEGDICKVHDFEVEITEIRWYEEGAGFAGLNRNMDNKLGNPWVGISPNHFEIIGNIYEHPHLLQP